MIKRLVRFGIVRPLLLPFGKAGMGCLLFFFFCSLGQGADGAYAQMKTENERADSYFENNEFSKAIPLYKKDSEKSDAALRRLGDCYRILKNYTEAELCYEKLAVKNSTDPQVFYYYGEALLNNNKYEEAKKQFLRYAEMNPSDKKGELYAKACDEMKDIIVKPALYKAYNLGNVNSEVSDFSPVFYKSGLVFSSERVRDLVNYSENSYTGNPFLSLVYAKATKKSVSAPVSTDSTAQVVSKDTMIYNKASLFSEKFIGEGHFGPACFTADFTEIFFTKVDDPATLKRGAVSLPKLYWSKRQSGWSSPKELTFVTGEYITGHPAISKDGTMLYFTSNMPGGQGGTDIWVSKREGETWGAPQNLGEGVNTPGDESFPYVSPNNILYFSSNGHAGFGGLDVFASVQEGNKWAKANNMMPPINSTSDDFGIIFKDDNSGYFSSNRVGGKGSDDLYGFALSGLITSISGKILLSQQTDDGAQQVKVFLLTDKGTIIQTTTTDATGFFQFQNLLSDQNYTLQVDETDPSLINQKKFYLTDAKNKIVRTIVKGKDGVFIFENLPPDLSRLSALNEDDVNMKNISIAGNLYVGDQRKALENAKVNLMNESGDVVQSTTTNAFGSFVFMNISPDQNLTVSLDESDPKIGSKKVFFTNKSGKEIAMSKDGNFRFQILASDTNSLSLLTVEDAQLKVELKGALFADKDGKDRLSNSKISLVDEKGSIVDSSKTDASGNFEFTNLTSDKNYLVRLNEDDPTLNSKDVFLANARGTVVATLKSANGKFFRYSFLPVEEQSLVSIYFDDPWLQVARNQFEEARKNEFSIAGTLTAGSRNTPVKKAKVNLVDGDGEVMQSVTTDASGSFVFMNLPPDNNFTIMLDDIDPEFASQAIYLANKNGKRIAHGETGTFKYQVLASDKNTISLLRVEDEQLRVVMKGTLYEDKEGKTRLRNATVSLVDENGNVIGTVQTDADGNFKFSNLLSDQTYTVRLNEEDPSLASKNIFLADAGGRIIAPLKAADGKFLKYAFLPSEEQALAAFYFDDAALPAPTKATGGSVAIIENVYYDYQRWALQPQAYTILDKVVKAMQANRSMTLEIVSNTDARGPEEYNLMLSRKRAQAAADYIVSKGISRNRLTAIGMGEAKPVNHCAEGVECTEEEYARNRRTEFNIKGDTK